MQTRRGLWKRYEVKFLIGEPLAARIRSFCRQNLQPDPNCIPYGNLQYPIHSVYLDSADHALARDVVDRQPDRYKLRVRTYRTINQPDETLPAYFEVKRKLHGLVYKSRAKLHRDRADGLLWRPDATDGASIDQSDIGEDLTKFLWLRHRLNARPMLSVYYTREAYEGDYGQRTRISFDRNLHYGLLQPTSRGCHEVWWPVPLSGVIFEVKFTDTYPAWLRNLLAKSELVRQGVCKYLLCSQAAKGLFQPIQERRVV